MIIDPVTTAAATAAITKTTSWLWDKYGKDLLDKASKAVMDKAGREGKKLWDERQWKSSAEKYLQGLYEEVSWLRVLGKPEGQPIERLYTDVNVLDKIAAEEWYGLHQLQEGYEVRRGLRWQREQRQDGLKLAQNSPRLFILGKPGAGKTTFMKHIALQAIKGKMGDKIPIFVSLHDLGNKDLPIVPYMVEQFRVHDFPEAEPFVRQLLKAGDGVVLFDGLDEVNVEGHRRDNLIAQMKDFIKEFHQSQIFITCRVAASDYTFERFTYVEMADFGDEQMKQFVFRWVQNDLSKRDNCWRELADKSNATLRELAQVPILLSLLCLVFD
ncbi:MAG: NACHT domain-containing protein, partial [Anaerolineae bacterium]|nr:NACHT domain-containing protein [Anaerolineae bacterium]